MNQRKKDEKPARKVSAQTAFLAAVVAGGCLTLGYILWSEWGSDDGHVNGLQLDEIPFNGARAYDYLKQLCEIGPRCSGSPGMAAQQKLLERHFRQLGGQVRWQRFKTEHPEEEGKPVPIANLIVHWHPQRTERILLCAHYDTLPFPMLDPENPRGRFVGANDGASGVALLMELAHEMPKLDCKFGVDFVLFDAEEFLFHEDGKFFIGSEHFARQYVRNPPPYRYRFGVLLDMMGDKDLQLYQEGYSATWPDTRPLVQDIWATAKRLGVREFVPRRGHEIKDDHVPLHEIAGIACCNIIDFDYPPWHTQNDVPEMCSPLSLAKVGWVIREWLQEVGEGGVDGG